MDKKEYIRRLAEFLVSTGTTMHVKELAGLLNWNGFQTGYNTPFKGGRGTYTLVHATYDSLTTEGKHQDAEQVAKAFKKPDGSYAYQK
jgi:hypothetical protein